MNSRAFFFMAGLGVVASGFAFDAAAQVTGGAGVVVATLPPRISLSCLNTGSHQDVAKTPIIKNNLRLTVPKGTVVQWKSSDGDHGAVTLESDLLPGKTVQGLGQAGQNYTCTADFSAGRPDLKIKSAQWGANNTVTVQVQNLNTFAIAGPSVTRLQVKSCSFNVLAQVDSPEVAIGKGETRTLTFNVPANAVSGNNFFYIKADATMKVIEKDENNNVWDAVSSCIH